MSKKIFIPLFLFLFFPAILFAAGTGAIDDPYTTIAEVNTALAGDCCGSTIYLNSDTYTTGTLTLDKDCTSGNEVTVAPSNGTALDLGGVKFTSAVVYVTGDYQILQGFDFDPAGASVISLELQGGACYNRVTECRFEDVGNNNGITIGRTSSNNTHNRFDHCSFIDAGTNGGWGGYMFRIRVDYDTAMGNIHNQIDHCVFNNHSSGGNYEDIQIGDGNPPEEVQEDGYNIIEYNLFLDSDSDNELVSVKNSSNIIRFNTFEDCNSAVTLRAGDDHQVYGNFWRHSGADITRINSAQIAGVRVFGHNQKVYNNYFEGTDSENYSPYIYIESGQSADDTDNQKQVYNALIANNTFKNTFRGIHFETDYAYEASECLFINNLGESTGAVRSGYLFAYHDGSHTWTTNRGHADGNTTLVEAGASATDSGTWELTGQKVGLPINWYYPNSYSNGTYNANVTVDIQGQTRANPPDIGNDEDNASTNYDVTVEVGCTWDATTETVQDQYSGFPTLSTATIAAAGTSITLAFNESVNVGTGGNGGWTITPSGGAATLSYASGDGTSSLVYTISRTIYTGETGTVSYTQPGDGIEDDEGNDLANITDDAVVNDSTQSEPAAGAVTWTCVGGAGGPSVVYDATGPAVTAP